jgi:hypothetical protein
MERSWLEFQFGPASEGRSFPVDTTLTWDATAIASVKRSPPAAGCGDNVDESYDQVRAASGTIDVGTFERFRRLAGRYDLVFETGESVSGSFEVPFCNADNHCNL